MGACLKKVLKITKGTLLNFSFRKINQLIINEIMIQRPGENNNYNKR